MQLACGRKRAPVFVLSHQIPGSLPCTVPSWLEIRHPSWSTIEEFEAIRAKTHDKGDNQCIALPQFVISMMVSPNDILTHSS